MKKKKNIVLLTLGVIVSVSLLSISEIYGADKATSNPDIQSSEVSPNAQQPEVSPEPPSVYNVERQATPQNGISIVSATEGYVFVPVSQTDVSVIICPYEITSYVYSTEKNIEAKLDKKHLYIKLLPVKKANNKLVYETSPRDLFVTCGGEVFSLILVPRSIPAQRIVLQPKIKPIEEVSAKEVSLPYEEMILNLITNAYSENVPDGYTVDTVSQKSSYKELDVILTKIYKGFKFIVEEYIIVAKQDIELYEPMFFDLVGSNVVAMTIVKNKLTSGEQTRLIVVKQSKG